MLDVPSERLTATSWVLPFLCATTFRAIADFILFTSLPPFFLTTGRSHREHRYSASLYIRTPATNFLITFETLSPGNDRQPPKSWCSARRQTWDPARWICSPHQRHACSGESAQSPAGKLCAGMGKHLSLFHFSVCHTHTPNVQEKRKNKKKISQSQVFMSLEFFRWMLLAPFVLFEIPSLSHPHTKRLSYSLTCVSRDKQEKLGNKENKHKRGMPRKRNSIFGGPFWNELAKQ